MSLDDTAKTFVDIDQRRVYTRNIAFEEKTLARRAQGPARRAGRRELSRRRSAPRGLRAPEQRLDVYIENQRLHVAKDFAMNVSTTTDWFDLQMHASVRGAKRASLSCSPRSNRRTEWSGSPTAPRDAPEGVARSSYASISEFAEKTEDDGLRFTKSQGLMLNAALGEDTST